MLDYVMSCGVMLCYVVIIMLCCVVLYYIILHYTKSRVGIFIARDLCLHDVCYFKKFD